MFGTGIARRLGIANFIDRLVRKIKIKRALKKEEIAAKKKIKADRIAVAQRQKTKIFVIGFNKTGTTSIHAALLEFDLILGHQRTAERLLDDMIAKRYESLYDYCQTAEAFQDVPFSCPDIYKLLDKKYPNSKFILTVRDSADQWYNSLTKFHGKLWGQKGAIPTQKDLAKATYIYKGAPLNALNYIFGRADYDPTSYKATYEKHNSEVQAYFKERSNDLLVINVSEKESYQQLCQFVGQKPLRDSFEWKNKTSELATKKINND